eukprot:COSAG05_NODE_5215_length_1234_cov_1.577093_2_plen_206_part_00
MNIINDMEEKDPRNPWVHILTGISLAQPKRTLTSTKHICLLALIALHTLLNDARSVSVSINLNCGRSFECRSHIEMTGVCPMYPSLSTAIVCLIIRSISCMGCRTLRMERRERPCERSGRGGTCAGQRPHRVPPYPFLFSPPPSPPSLPFSAASSSSSASASSASSAFGFVVHLCLRHFSLGEYCRLRCTTTHTHTHSRRTDRRL